MLRLALVLLLLVAAILLPTPQVAAQPYCFPDQPDITDCLVEPFSTYWQAHGSLPVFGYPISAAQPEWSSEGNVAFTTQWTERFRLEHHSNNAAPFNVLLGRMGAERLAQLGRGAFLNEREPGPLPDCLWFEDTGHNVCNQQNNLGFRTYWESNGLNASGFDRFTRSLQLFGLPLTAAQPEMSSTGEMILTQWFERARLEWHPQNPDPFKVLQGLLGRELRSNALSVASAAPSVFGVVISKGNAGATAGPAREAGISWVRAGEVMWAKVEPRPGTRDWSEYRAFEADLQFISANGLIPIVTVLGTPYWAQAREGVLCGQMRPETLDAFATFMGDLVTRYSAPPFNVRYYQIWNEPDIDPSKVNPTSGFGCWGDANDPLYGGGYYATMLQRIYPAIKTANPNAQVVMGGLLLDCDPDAPPVGKDCRSARFLEGVLSAGGANSFDILSYHGYSYWTEELEDYDRSGPNWAARGGSVLGKLAFIRSTFSQYGVSKPILLDEAALMCYRSNPVCREDFDQAQAEYLTRLYARGWANDLSGIMWYTMNPPGWQRSNLIDANQNPRPAYYALQFLATRLTGATYVGSLNSGPVEGYAFETPTIRYEISWTNGAGSVSVPLPSGTRAVYDSLGQALPLPTDSLTISFAPRIVEIAR